MAKASRDKGKRGELEVVHLFRKYGFEASRNYDQSNPDAVGVDVKTDVRGVDGLHGQIKRQETLKLPEWIRQAEDEAPEDSIPCVIYRKNHPATPHRWRIDLDLEDFMPLLLAWRNVVNRVAGAGI